MIVCQHCDGKGRFDSDTGFARCRFCRGNGMVDSLNGEHPLAATVESLRSELEAERAHVTRLQGALAFWMPGVSEEIETELNGRAGDDACLLAGFDGDVPEVSWGDAIRSELEAVKVDRDELDFLYHEGGTMEAQLAEAEARATEAEAELEAVKRERDGALESARKNLLWCMGTGAMQGAEAMTDIPRSVMEEALQVARRHKATGFGTDEALARDIARFALARDKRAAGIARNNDPFPEEGEYIASLILTYPEGKEDGL